MMPATTTRRRRGSPPAAERAAPAKGAQDASVRVLRQFRVIFNAVKTHFQQVEKRAGLGGAQVWALSVIRDRPGLGINDLAAAIDVKQPTASNLVKSLAEQELVEVRRHERDRRAVMLYLRPGGARLLRRAPVPFTGVLPQALANLDETTLVRLEHDLGALIGLLAADERGATIPLGHM
jgi:DNA-binding MarR family transcriptional regulator